MDTEETLRRYDDLILKTPGIDQYYQQTQQNLFTPNEQDNSRRNDFISSTTTTATGSILPPGTLNNYPWKTTHHRSFTTYEFPTHTRAFSNVTIEQPQFYNSHGQFKPHFLPTHRQLPPYPLVAGKGASVCPLKVRCGQQQQYLLAPTYYAPPPPPPRAAATYPSSPITVNAVVQPREEPQKIKPLVARTVHPPRSRVSPPRERVVRASRAMEVNEREVSPIDTNLKQDHRKIRASSPELPFKGVKDLIYHFESQTSESPNDSTQRNLVQSIRLDIPDKQIALRYTGGSSKKQPRAISVFLGNAEKSRRESRVVSIVFDAEDCIDIRCQNRNGEACLFSTTAAKKPAETIEKSKRKGYQILVIPLIEQEETTEEECSPSNSPLDGDVPDGDFQLPPNSPSPRRKVCCETFPSNDGQAEGSAIVGDTVVSDSHFSYLPARSDEQLNSSSGEETLIPEDNTQNEADCFDAHQSPAWGDSNWQMKHDGQKGWASDSVSQNCYHHHYHRCDKMYRNDQSVQTTHRYIADGDRIPEDVTSFTDVNNGWQHRVTLPREASPATTSCSSTSKIQVNANDCRATTTKARKRREQRLRRRARIRNVQHKLLTMLSKEIGQDEELSMIMKFKDSVKSDEIALEYLERGIQRIKTASGPVSETL